MSSTQSVKATTQTGPDPHANPGGGGWIGVQARPDLPALAIPPFRLPRDVLRHELAVIEALGIELRCNEPVARDLRADGFGT